MFTKLKRSAEKLALALALCLGLTSTASAIELTMYYPVAVGGALTKIVDDASMPDGCVTVNLGTGKSTSVLELVAAFAKASGKEIPTKIVARRPGDAAEVYAKTEKAKEVFGWEAKLDIERCCVDQWKWASANPYGYGTEADAA